MSQCQAARHTQRRKLEQLQYGIEQNLVLAGVAEGKPKRNQGAMVPAEYGLHDTVLYFYWRFSVEISCGTLWELSFGWLKYIMKLKMLGVVGVSVSIKMERIHYPSW